MYEILVLILKSSVLPSVVAAVVSAISNRSRSKKVDRFLLLQSLKLCGNEYIREQGITLKDLECMQEAYDLYHDLGGDGFADAMMGKVKALPIRIE